MQGFVSPFAAFSVDGGRKSAYNNPIEKKEFCYESENDTFTYKREPFGDSQFPFAGHPFYVILSAQLGGSWVGEVNPADLPVKMEIDYVRFYLPKK